MARILISKNGELLKQIPITADRTRIGRGPINQLCFVDSTVSRFHAEIVRRGFCYVIEDKKSVNGTRLNGSLLTEKEILSDYDEIVIGEYTLVFLSDETDSPVAIHPESFDASATVYVLRR
ncbi:MAG: FHA domain-containing protein [Desulfuromonadales bacterium]|nr:FHA domain-containing protein [Desulfuromonadales bacterium]